MCKKRHVPINTDVSSLDNFNDELEDTINANGYVDITTDYESATYISGDFTLSLAMAYEHVKDAYNSYFSDGTLHNSYNGSVVYQGRNGSYNLLFDNCFDRTFSTFAYGVLSDGTSASIYTMAYGITDAGISYPNDNISKFSKAFGNKSFTKLGASMSISNKLEKYSKGKYSALPGQIRYFKSF